MSTFPMASADIHNGKFCTVHFSMIQYHRIKKRSQQYQCDGLRGPDDSGSGGRQQGNHFTPLLLRILTLAGHASDHRNGDSVIFRMVVGPKVHGSENPQNISCRIVYVTSPVTCLW